MTNSGIRFLITTVAVLAMPAQADDDGTGNIACEITVEDVEYCSIDADTLLPDLMTVQPKHLSIQNKQQTEILRFSNGLANLGDGPWWLQPGAPEQGDTATCQNAFQLVVSAEQFVDRRISAPAGQVPAPDGTFVDQCQKGKFDYHETHNHWHIANVGSFKVCRWEDFYAGTDENLKYIVKTACLPAELEDGHAVGIKFTFCLIDWYKLADNSPTSDATRNFWDCVTSFQGITPQWVDQYHHATDGQDIEITGLPVGRYVLVSTVNTELFDRPLFEESNTQNNTSWMVFDLARENNLDSNSKRNARLTEVEGACSANYSYMEEQLIPAVERFVDRYHPNNESIFEELIFGMCGGQSLNR